MKIRNLAVQQLASTSTTAKGDSGFRHCRPRNDDACLAGGYT